MVLKVILDSNFLFLPFQFKIDIFEELKNLLKQRIEVILLSSTIKEIQEIAQKGSQKMRQQALFALRLSESCQIVEVPILNTYNTPDDVIFRIAMELLCPVATNDKMLRKRLKNINVPVIYLREMSHLEMDGDI